MSAKRNYKRSKPHNIPQRTIILLQLMAENGFTVAEIAKATRLSRMHVYRLIEKYNEEATSSPPASS